MKNRVLSKYSFGFLVAIIAVSFLFLTNISGAWFSDRELTNAGNMSFPVISMGEVSNPSITEHIDVGELTVPPITTQITNNVRIAIRARVIVKWYDSGNVYVTSGLNPSLNLTATNWTKANGGLEYYYDEIVLASDVPQVISLQFTAELNDADDEIAYSGYSFAVETSLEYHQADYVDYNNHTWKSTAPVSWINSIKGGAL